MIDMQPEPSAMLRDSLGVATPVSFRNRKGLKLFGVLHTPTRACPGKLAVLLLSPGVKMRVGPERLYLQMTARFLELGLSVLRFDFHGLGDSEGTLPEDQLRDVYNHIEVGRFVDDTVDAMNWMQQSYDSQQFILSGLCGGAITGLLTGERDPRVAGLLALGITPVLASRAAEASLYMTIGQLEAQQRMYLRRLLSPEAWFRLLTLRTDNRLIRRMMTHWVRKSLGRTPPPVTTPQAEADNANPLFPPAFFKMLSSRRPMLLIFGGSDRLHWEYEEKFVARHRERLTSVPPLAEVHVVEHANHVLSLREWQEEMLDVTTRWLRRHFLTDPVRQLRSAEVTAKVAADA
jgi:pimeloyl-ACP methyl ester carboxylesterase